MISSPTTKPGSESGGVPMDYSGNTTFGTAWKNPSAARASTKTRGRRSTAERRHPKFRSHGVGHCEWDGAVWPFATSQTLNALANVLRNYSQAHVTKQHFFDAMQTYAKSQRMNGRPYIGEYLDECTGQW